MKAEALVENITDGETFTLPMSPVANPNAILEDNGSTDEAATVSEVDNIQRLGFSADLSKQLHEEKDYLISFAITTSDGTVLSSGQDSTSYRKEKYGGTTSLSDGSLSLKP